MSAVSFIIRAVEPEALFKGQIEATEENLDEKIKKLVLPLIFCDQYDIALEFLPEGREAPLSVHGFYRDSISQDIFKIKKTYLLELEEEISLVKELKPETCAREREASEPFHPTYKNKSKKYFILFRPFIALYHFFSHTFKNLTIN